MRCLKSCAAVAIALRTNFEPGLLSCTLYCAAAAGQPAVDAMDEVLQEFLEVNPFRDGFTLKRFYAVVLQHIGVMWHLLHALTGAIQYASKRRGRTGRGRRLIAFRPVPGGGSNDAPLATSDSACCGKFK